MNFRRGFRLQLRNLWELPSAGSASTALISQSSGAANAVLETQESTLLRVVTRQLQVVNGESRARIICSWTRRRIHQASVAPRIS